MLVTFLVGIQLARGLGVEGYGLYGVAMAIISLAGVPSEFGLPRLVIREVAASAARPDLPALFGVIRWANRTSLLISGLMAGAIAAGAYLTLAAQPSTVAAALLIGAPIIPLVALSKVRGAALQGLHFVVLGQIPIDLLRPLLLSAGLFALFHWSSDAGAPQVMAINGATAVASLVLAHFWLRSRLPPSRPAAPVRDGRRWIASSLPMALVDGARILELQLGILMLGIAGSAEQVGLFRIAGSTAIVAALPIGMINRVAAPVLAKLFAERDMRRLQRVCTHSAQAMTLAVLVLILPLVFWAPSLLALVFGREFAPAAPALVLLSAAFLASAAFGSNATLLTMAGHERRVTRAMFIGLAVNVLLSITLVPAWQSLGSAIALCSSILLWNLLTWLDARRLLHVDTSVFAALQGRFR